MSSSTRIYRVVSEFLILLLQMILIDLILPYSGLMLLVLERLDWPGLLLRLKELRRVERERSSVVGVEDVAQFYIITSSINTIANRSLRVTPPFIVPHPELLTDTAPKERWNLDILEQQGEVRLKEIVGHIEAMVADLRLH